MITLPIGAGGLFHHLNRRSMGVKDIMRQVLHLVMGLMSEERDVRYLRGKEVGRGNVLRGVGRCFGLLRIMRVRMGRVAVGLFSHAQTGLAPPAEWIPDCTTRAFSATEYPLGLRGFSSPRRVDS